MKGLVLFALLCIVISQVQAKLLISPTRLSFAPNERSKEVILINTTTTEMTYRIEWKDMIPLSGGGYQAIEEGGGAPESSARDILRFSPRQVTLQPGERQVIKVLARRTPSFNLPEYRSHLNFIAIPPEVSAPEEPTTNGMSMLLNVFMNYSIPTIVKNSTSNVNVKLENAQLQLDVERNRAELSVELVREGNQSFFGKMRVYSLLPDEKKLVGQLNGINLFTPLSRYSRRVALIDLDMNTRTNHNLVVELMGDAEDVAIPKSTLVVQ